MTIAASGNAVSFSALRTEFVGGSSSISLSDLYRGGSNILSKAGDNPAVNLAASVPTSGAIDFSDFHSTAKGFKSTISSTTTNLVANTLFGDDYDVNYPKIIDINSGVTIGGVSSEALTIPSGLAGTLVINNAGNIYGAGGVANGGDGRVAVYNQSSGVTINNTGEIRGGGGGGGIGGTGGTGGQGSYTTVSYAYTHGSRAWWCYDTCGTPGDCAVFYGGSYTIGRPIPNTTTVYGNYYKGGGAQYGGSCQYGYSLGIGSTAYSSGGAGGAGGSPAVGQGYNQAAGTGGAGSGGAAGGTNAGSGGQGGNGGNGGSWATAGQAGSAGSAGANGNYSNGSAGAGGGAGGAAGAAVSGTSVTMNNTGTISGTVA